jgi:hypothetical protein
VAGEASDVDGFRGKYAGLSRMTRGAFFFQDGMRFRQTAAAVDAQVFQDSPSGDPDKHEQRQQETEPESGPLHRRRPLEIVEVDALRQFFCCACACHVFLLR